MEKSSFFNAELVGEEYDRSYLAEDFAAYFASFIGNGVFPNPSNNLQVISNNDMTVYLNAGKGWINGYIYVNTTNLKLNITPADGVLNRIDRVVLRLDFINREIKAYVKKGTFASSPVAPVLQRDADMYELGLADIYIKAGAISIAQADIMDLRLNNSYCGIVHGVVDQVDTTSLFNQFENWYSTTKTNYDTDITKWTQEKKNEYISWFNLTKEQKQQEFTTWFNSVKGQMNSDLGTKLSSDMVTVKTTIEDLNVKTFCLEEVVDGINMNMVDKNHLNSSVIDASTTKAANSLAVKTAMDRANEAFRSASNGKNLIANAITGKGITASNTDTFSILATKISQINTGKRYYGGTIYFQIGSRNEEPKFFTKTLEFTPSVIVCRVVGAAYYDVEEWNGNEWVYSFSSSTKCDEHYIIFKNQPLLTRYDKFDLEILTLTSDNTFSCRYNYEWLPANANTPSSNSFRLEWVVYE